MTKHRKSATLLPHFLLALLITIETARCQQTGPISFTLVEEQGAGTPVGNVAQRSGIQATVTPEVFRSLEYQILSSQSQRITSLFRIDSGTGELLTNDVIDREKVCDAAAVTCQLEFDVTVKSGVNVIKILNVVVIVMDKNDNPPAFPTAELPLSISEAAPTGSEISITGAIDPDAGLVANLTYWMEESDVFQLQEDRLLDVSVLKIVLTRALDRETQSEYHLKIYAKDGQGEGAKTGTLAVTVTVTDMNDHRPEFSQPVYNFTVKESAAVGSVVGEIEATDKDEGPNGEVAFHFSSLTSSEVTRLFSLDPSTGEVKVKSDLQFESGRKFQAVVEAKDKGGSPRAAQAVLVLRVLDAGNTPPRLALTLAGPLSQDGDVELMEDLPVGSFVGTLKYQDTDEGKNGQVSCVCLNSHFRLSPLEESGYAIEIKSQLDREAQPTVTVTLRCSDGGEPSLSSTASFTAVVGDVNDNPPVFQSPDYTTRVSEAVASRPNLIRVSASDADAGESGSVTYQLSADSSNAFSIDPFSGWLSLTSPVDREAGPVVDLTVLAVDSGQPRLNGSVTVTVNVDDVNDNTPEIVRLEYRARENQGSGAFVGQVVGADSDSGINGDLRYRLVEDKSGGFRVSDSGLISTTMTFDREKLDHYTVLVEVRDRGSPVHSSTATLTIIITDANDHSPQILYPVPGNDSITVNAGLSPGTVVAKARATDADTGKNAKLVFLIAEGNPHKLFSIDNATGTIFVSRQLTSSRETSYRLTISVQDSGSPRWHNSSYLHVTVDFSNATYLGGASENEHKYVIIAGVIAGVTLAIAIIVVAIILKLRHMDITRCAGRGAKVKSAHGPMVPPSGTTAVAVKQPGHLSVSAGSAYMVDQSDQDAGFGDSRYGGPRGVHTTLESFVPRNVHQTTQVAAGDARPPPGNEDVTSDSSADVTASDSGRGASDTEDAASAGALGIPATQLYAPPPRDSAPWVPPRNPVGVSPALTDSSTSLGCLPRAARAYASHKDFQRPRRPAGKVRFSVDDQQLGEEPSVLWTGEGRGHGHPDPPPAYQQGWRGPQAGQKPHILYAPNPSHNRPPSSLSLQSRPAPSSHVMHSHDQTRPPTSGHNLSSSSSSLPSSTQPDIFHSLNTSSTSSGADSMNRPQSKLAPPSARLAPPPSNFPLLQHQRSRSQRPSHNRVLLPTLNASIDEDDDDGGSTTTSGSYAVEDNILNISVEC